MRIRATVVLKEDVVLKVDAASVAAMALLDAMICADGVLDHVQHSGLALPKMSLQIVALHSGRVLLSSLVFSSESLFLWEFLAEP